MHVNTGGEIRKEGSELATTDVLDSCLMCTSKASLTSSNKISLLRNTEESEGWYCTAHCFWLECRHTNLRPHTSFGGPRCNTARRFQSSQARTGSILTSRCNRIVQLQQRQSWRIPQNGSAINVIPPDTEISQPSTSYSQSSSQSQEQIQHRGPTRRVALAVVAATTSVLLAPTAPSSASKLPFLDGVWESVGGGPADLVFPDSFVGVWDVTSILTRVDTPLGEDAVPNLAAVRRAQREDLDRPTRYQVAFVQNGNGKVVYDRRFNTAAMLSMYYDNTMSFQERIKWNIDDPNILTLAMPGMSVRTRVTRRSEDFPQPDRIETSEYVESVYDSSDGGAPRVKASQCFTKYKFRSEEAARRDQGPAIVATQVVSDFLTPFDGEQQYLQAMNKPYAQYTYRMAFRRAAGAAL